MSLRAVDHGIMKQREQLSITHQPILLQDKVTAKATQPPGCGPSAQPLSLVPLALLFIIHSFILNFYLLILEKDRMGERGEKHGFAVPRIAAFIG